MTGPENWITTRTTQSPTLELLLTLISPSDFLSHRVFRCIKSIGERQRLTVSCALEIPWSSTSVSLFLPTKQILPHQNRFEATFATSPQQCRTSSPVSPSSTATSVALENVDKSAKSLAPSFAAENSVLRSSPTLSWHSSPSPSVSVAVSAPRSALLTPSPSSTCPPTSKARSPTDMDPTVSSCTVCPCPDPARFLVWSEQTVLERVPL
ncbi:hypothetical protein DER46DRAFT_195470 [Fusarium sp. MPI-SDFR-AT-0072]|nr:hypothetical protein DER46DRAFT_195470 [Fusarium sp. MPI-SDFR-AT-0072]